MALCDLDMSYVRAREEQRYKGRVLSLLQISAYRDTDVTLEVGRDALISEYPYDRLYWLDQLVRGHDSMTEARA